MWTLIVVILSASPVDSKSNQVSSFTVAGFSTEQACVNAGNKILVPVHPISYVETNTKFTCVSKDV
ncbi:hypothetical protein D3C85_1565140 [compost metagenome]